MANLRMTLLDLLNKSEQGVDPNFLRDGMQLLAQELKQAEVTDLVGAEPHQRTAGRATYRNGYRDREWDTRVGTHELQIPKLRQGTYFPSLLEPRRRHERAIDQRRPNPSTVINSDQGTSPGSTGPRNKGLLNGL